MNEPTTRPPVIDPRALRDDYEYRLQNMTILTRIETTMTERFRQIADWQENHEEKDEIREKQMIDKISEVKSANKTTSSEVSDIKSDRDKAFGGGWTLLTLLGGLVTIIGLLIAVLNMHH